MSSCWWGRSVASGRNHHNVTFHPHNECESNRSNMAQPSPTASGTVTPSPSANLESLDFGHPHPRHPRPFKSPSTKPRTARRNKNLKQILQDEQKALLAQASAEDNTKAFVKGKLGRTLRVEGLQWSDIDAPPSLLPQKK